MPDLEPAENPSAPPSTLFRLIQRKPLEVSIVLLGLSALLSLIDESAALIANAWFVIGLYVIAERLDFKRVSRFKQRDWGRVGILVWGWPLVLLRSPDR